MAYSVIELRVLGPMGKPYVDIANELQHEFEKEGIIFRVPRLLSAPEITTVVVHIGVGVSVYFLSKLVDRLLQIRKGDEQKETEITVNIQINNYNYSLPEEADKLSNDYPKEIEKQSSNDEHKNC